MKRGDRMKLRLGYHKDDILQLGIKLWWEEASLIFFLPCLFVAIYWRKDDPGITELWELGDKGDE